MTAVTRSPLVANSYSKAIGSIPFCSSGSNESLRTSTVSDNPSIQFGLSARFLFVSPIRHQPTAAALIACKATLRGLERHARQQSHEARTTNHGEMHDLDPKSRWAMRLADQSVACLKCMSMRRTSPPTPEVRRALLR
jgi:hypothetical protein